MINVSSPNTPGLRDLQKLAASRKSSALCGKKIWKPLLVKIAPDLSDEQTAEIAAWRERGGRWAALRQIPRSITRRSPENATNRAV